MKTFVVFCTSLRRFVESLVVSLLQAHVPPPQTLINNSHEMLKVAGHRIKGAACTVILHGSRADGLHSE